MYTIRAIYYTILQTTPIQLIFGRDTILNIEFYTDWIYIKNRKQKIIKSNNARENTKRITHQYKIGNKVLYKIHSLSKFGVVQKKGLYNIVAVNNTNGKIKIQISKVIDTVNIRLLTPYKEQNLFFTHLKPLCGGECNIPVVVY